MNRDVKVPEGWQKVRLEDCADFRMGKTPPRSEGKWWGNDFPWVSIADMVDGCVVSKTKEGVSELAAQEKFRERISPAGTLLMSFKLTVGRVSLLGVDAYHNEAIISIFPHNDIDKQFLFRYLPLAVAKVEFEDAAKGKMLNSASLANIELTLPPLPNRRQLLACCRMWMRWFRYWIDRSRSRKVCVMGCGRG